MDDDLYDEFGNPIGGQDDEQFDSESLNASNLAHLDDEASESGVDDEMRNDEAETNLVLHADAGKEHTIEDVDADLHKALLLKTVYGKGVETIVASEDVPMEDEPVIKPLTETKMKVEYTDFEDDQDGISPSRGIPEVTYSREYMLSIMNSMPERVRNISIVGNLHSGKSTFVDMFVLQTHPGITTPDNALNNFKPLRYLDNHKLEIQRGITIKSSPITLLLSDPRDRSYIFNFVDTPGHINFNDEVVASLAGTDGAVVIIDVVEGVTYRDHIIISDLLRLNVPFVVSLNKIDRLIMELKLPPADAYHKMQNIIDDLNSFIISNEYVASYRFDKEYSPIHGNVMFSSANFNLCFTLNSFAALYQFDKGDQAYLERLWGDFYYNPHNNSFTRSSNDGNFQRTFVAFILNPLYKLFTYTITADLSDKRLPSLLWSNFRVNLDKSVYKKDPQILLRYILRAIFPNASGFVELVAKCIPSPESFFKKRYENNKLPQSNYKGVPMAQVLKLIENSNGKGFVSLVRIYHGSLKVGDRVKVLGENFDEDQDDYKLEIVDAIFLAGGRYKIPIKNAPLGSLVLISGVDSIINKTATICNTNDTDLLWTFPRLNFEIKSVLKVAVEPSNPSELPKLIESLRQVSKSYLACSIKVEDSGEHVILAPGEIYMDCLLHDLRFFFADDLEIKVSDLSTKFSETCADISAIKITSRSQSRENAISITAEPVGDQKLSYAIEKGVISLSNPPEETSNALSKDFGWDILASKSVWCFGPDDLNSPDILMDDTIEGETDKTALFSIKDSINLGFKWSVNEGPLCDEPIRNTKFKILDAVVSGSEIKRNGTQVIPMTRKACYSGFLTASPRLMEPIYSVFITTTFKAIRAVDGLLRKRRGKLIEEYPIPATPLYTLRGHIPVIESVGFESDLRAQTQGQAMCLLDFEKWKIVPGDPLDQECFLPPLQPVPTESLARDFVLKTRRRKGLSGEPSLRKYIEPELYNKLVENSLI